MNKFYCVFFITVMLLSCSNEEKKNDSPKSQTQVNKPDLASYLASVNTLRIEAISDAVLYYQQNFKPSSPMSCDSQLVLLKNFALRATNDMNEHGIVNDYVDENGELSEVNRKKFKKIGLLVAWSEGSPYFIVDAGYLKKHMQKCLSKPMMTFLDEFELENEKVPVEDAGIIIELNEMSRRLIFWEKFIIDNPGFILENEAKATYNFYLALYLTGIDNTLAFGLTTGLLNPEFMKMYRLVLDKYPKTKTASLTRDYVSVLEKNEYVLNANVEAFLDNVESPFMQELEQ